MKKIIYYSFSRIPSKSAHAVHIMKMCSGIAKNGYDVCLITHLTETDLSKIFSDYGISECFRIISFPMPNIRILGRAVYFILSIFYLLISKPCLIYTRDIFSAFALSVFKKEIIFEIHQIHENFLRKIMLKAIVKLNSYKLIVCISETMREMLLRDFKVKNESKIIKAHDGADIEKFEMEISQKQIRQKLDLDLNNCLIGYTGNLYEGRGIDLIIELASLVREAEFVVVGGSEERIFFYKEKMKEKGIKNVTFKGHVSNSMVPLYLKAFDILLMPYQKKVMLDNNKFNIADFFSPLKMFEYMASGKPIISSRLKVLEEVLTHKENAFLVEPDKIQEWKEAVSLLREDREFAEKLGENAMETAKQYSWDKRAEFILREK